MRRIVILGALVAALGLTTLEAAGQQDRKNTKPPTGSTKPTQKQPHKQKLPDKSPDKQKQADKLPEKQKQADKLPEKQKLSEKLQQSAKFPGGAVVGGKGKLATQETHTRRMYARIPDANLSSDERKAFDNLAGGRELSRDERRMLRELAASNRPGLTPDVREGISVMLNAVDPPASRNPVAQGQRYLRVKNGTAEPLTVHVLFRSQHADGSWAWVPAEPESPQAALTFTVEPGEVTFLTHADKFISASRVRLWAESSMQEWAEYRDQDLRLVTETDPKLKQYVYYADTVQAYLFTFQAVGGE